MPARCKYTSATAWVKGNQFFSFHFTLRSTCIPSIKGLWVHSIGKSRYKLYGWLKFVDTKFSQPTL